MKYTEEEKFLFNLNDDVDLTFHALELGKIDDKKLLSGFFTSILVNMDACEKKTNIISLLLDLDSRIDIDDMDYFLLKKVEYLESIVRLDSCSINFLKQIMEIPKDNLTVDIIRNANIKLDYTLDELEYIKDDLLENGLYEALPIIQEKIDSINL